MEQQDVAGSERDDEPVVIWPDFDGQWRGDLGLGPLTADETATLFDEIGRAAGDASWSDQMQAVYDHYQGLWVVNYPAFSYPLILNCADSDVPFTQWMYRYFKRVVNAFDSRPLLVEPPDLQALYAVEHLAPPSLEPALFDLSRPFESPFKRSRSLLGVVDDHFYNRAFQKVAQRRAAAAGIYHAIKPRP